MGQQNVSAYINYSRYIGKGQIFVDTD